MGLFPRRVANSDHASVKRTLRLPCDIARQIRGVQALPGKRLLFVEIYATNK